MNSFKSQPRKNPQDITAPEKFYAAAISNGEVDMEKLSELIAYQTTLTPPDIYAVLMALEHNAISQLEEGKIVKLGNLGTFRVSISSQGVDTAEAVTADAITKRRILFRPGKKLQRLLNNLTFKKAG